MTKPSSAKIADKNSLSPPVNRNSMQKKALRTNRSAANPVVMHAKVTTIHVETVALVRCTMQFVQSAAHPARFLSNLVMTALFIAATASEDKQANIKARSERGVPLLFVIFKKLLIKRFLAR